MAVTYAFLRKTQSEHDRKSAPATDENENSDDSDDDGNADDDRVGVAVVRKNAGDEDNAAPWEDDGDDQSAEAVEFRDFRRRISHIKPDAYTEQVKRQYDLYIAQNNKKS